MITKTDVEKRFLKSGEKEVSKISLIPLHDNVIVKFKDAEKESAGGIILVESAMRKIQQGIVTALPADEKVTKVLSIGTEVIFGEHAGVAIEVNKEKFLVLAFEEIMVILVSKQEEVPVLCGIKGEK